MQNLNYGPPNGYRYDQFYAPPAPRQGIVYSPIAAPSLVRSVPDVIRVKMANSAVVASRDSTSAAPMMVPYSSHASQSMPQAPPPPPWMALNNIPREPPVQTQQTSYQLRMIPPSSPAPSYIPYGYSSPVLQTNYCASFPPLNPNRRAFSMPVPQQMYVKQVAGPSRDVGGGATTTTTTTTATPMNTAKPTATAINNTKPKDDSSPAGKQVRRKRSQSEVLAYSLSIAGTSCNSNAVYKRLKPSKIVPTNDKSRVQGRPFSSSLTGRFILHDDVLSFLRYSTHDRKMEKIVCYDFGGKPSNCTADSGRSRSLSGATGSPSDDPVVSFPSGSNNRIILSQLKEISTSILGSHDPVEELDRFLGKKNCSVNLVNYTRHEGMPERHTITNSPSDLNRTSLLSTTYYLPSSELKAEEKPEKLPAEKIPAHRSPHSLNLILNDDDSKADRRSQNDQQKDEELNFHSSIGRAFDIKKYQFIKVIRDSNGHILKLQSIPPPTNENNEIEYTAEWIKKTVCYPRYKHDMKIHLVRNDQSFILYKDLNMMLWDIGQENGLENVEKPLRPSIRDFLFREKAVYVSIA
ncbi:DEKNAAC103779 [Brettanomyces naardenensis]|uniref:DEKNAAC103779 n=1 Tax=Brettanomyces naardenensis TaxID=13370 RepID=A0A448YP66_BRENA|nr:DEKNAAC103779 [Brettanomyces naardenensis]